MRKNIPNKYVGDALYEFLKQRRIFERLVYAVTEPQHCLYSHHSRLIFIEFFVGAENLEALENDPANETGGTFESRGREWEGISKFKRTS